MKGLAGAEQATAAQRQEVARRLLTQGESASEQGGGLLLAALSEVLKGGLEDVSVVEAALPKLERRYGSSHHTRRGWLKSALCPQLDDTSSQHAGPRSAA